jgi:hypothetical protein
LLAVVAGLSMMKWQLSAAGTFVCPLLCTVMFLLGNLGPFKGSGAKFGPQMGLGQGVVLFWGAGALVKVCPSGD